MTTKEDISTLLMRTVMSSGANHVTVEDDGFSSNLLGGDSKRYHRRAVRLNAIVLVTIATVALLIYGITFYFQQVLLYPSQMHFNRYGSYVIKKSPNSEYAMFLFDASVMWQPSGIQVKENDIVLISASGGYHTNINKLVEAAKRNSRADIGQIVLKKEWSDKNALPDTMRYVFMPEANLKNAVTKLDTINRRIGNLPKDLSHYQDSRFGDVLFQVCPEYKVQDLQHEDTSKIYAIPHSPCKSKHRLKIHESGILSFAVNDSNPKNNVGQILVVMEIFHSEDCKQAWRNAACGKILEGPYFLYDLIKHRYNTGWATFLATMVFVLLVVAEWLIICALAYGIPFLFIKETWHKCPKKQ